MSQDPNCDSPRILLAQNNLEASASWNEIIHANSNYKASGRRRCHGVVPGRASRNADARLLHFSRS